MRTRLQRLLLVFLSALPIVSVSFRAKEVLFFYGEPSSSGSNDAEGSGGGMSRT